MSLILEALRKSEAERQVGHVPGLMSPSLPLRRQRARWPGAVILIALVLAIAGLAWWLGRLTADEERADAPAPATAASSVQADASPATASEPAALPATAAAPTTTPSVPAPAPAAASADDAAKFPPAMAPPKAETPATVESTPEPPKVLTLGPPPAPSSPPTAVPSAAPVEAPLPSFPSLELMPPSQRSALPALKLSVHVYSEDPQRRFAVIDGRRSVDGDELSGGVRVREIRRDGVLLDVGGQPWLLPRAR